MTINPPLIMSLLKEYILLMIKVKFNYADENCRLQWSLVVDINLFDTCRFDKNAVNIMGKTCSH